MVAIAERLRRVPPYPFVAISQKVRSLQARGVDVIRMDIGAPDMPPPAQAVEILAEAVHRPDRHGYPGYVGTPELRAAFAAYYERRFGVVLDPEREVLPLIGSKEGLFHITQALVNPGDVVLIPDPGYPTYRSAALVAGATIYPLPLRPDRGFLPDLGGIPDAVWQRTKLLWLNYPNNPTGAVAPLEFFEEAVHLARRWDVLVCHDAPYTEVTFDGVSAVSVLQVPGAKEVAVEFNSLSKSLHVPGWRVGVAVGNEAAIAALLRMKSNVDTGIFLPIQHAAAAALHALDPRWVAERNAAYARRRDMLIPALEALGLRAYRPQGALYVWAQVPSGYDDLTFVDQVLERAAVAITPGRVYGEQGRNHVRFSLGVADDRLAEAIDRLRRAFHA